MDSEKDTGDENPLLGRDGGDEGSDFEGATAPQEPVDESSRRPGPCHAVTKPSYTVALLLVTTACLYADQNIIAPNMSAIASEFKLSDEARML